MKRFNSLKPGSIFSLGSLVYKLVRFGKYTVDLVYFYEPKNSDGLLIPLQLIKLPLSFIKVTTLVAPLDCIELPDRNEIHCFYRIKY